MRPDCSASGSMGFTLIELLIVIAIIAILALIAIPNFLEAQIRAKVSRVASDLRSIATGLEAYVVDHGEYPRSHELMGPFVDFRGGHGAYVGRLSTPVAYVSSALSDPFTPHTRASKGFGYDFYEYWNERDPLAPVSGRRFDFVSFAAKGTGGGAVWALWSYGPDRDANRGPSNVYLPVLDDPIYNPGDTAFFDTIYDPTNATMSGGNIYRMGP